jgi:hypothetical protein
MTAMSKARAAVNTAMRPLGARRYGDGEDPVGSWMLVGVGRDSSLISGHVPGDGQAWVRLPVIPFARPDLCRA